MQDEQLVSNLRNKGRFSRLSALKKLAASEDFKPEQNRKANFNFHCRTEYSCFGSTPSLEAYRLMKNGFPAVAIVDYASLSGAKELMKAEKILGGLYYIGAETDVEDEKGAPVRMISMGIPHKNVKAFNFDLFFYRKIQNDFTDQLLGKLNSRLKKYGITVSTPPRSFFKTTSTEDVFVCLADAIIEKFRTADKITAFITQDLGISLSEYDEKRLEDTANVYYEIDLAATLFFNYKMKLPPRKLKKFRNSLPRATVSGQFPRSLWRATKTKRSTSPLKTESGAWFSISTNNPTISTRGLFTTSASRRIFCRLREWFAITPKRNSSASSATKKQRAFTEKRLLP